MICSEPSYPIHKTLCRRAARLFGKAGSRLKVLQGELREHLQQRPGGRAEPSGDPEAEGLGLGLNGAEPGSAAASSTGARGRELAARAAGLGRRVTGQLWGARARGAGTNAAGAPADDVSASAAAGAAQSGSGAAQGAAGHPAAGFAGGGLTLEDLLGPPGGQRRASGKK